MVDDVTATVTTPEDLLPIDVEIDALKVRVEALESVPPPEGPLTAPWVGAYVGQQTGTPNYPALWKTAQREYGPLHVWRCFDSSIKTPVTARYNSVPGPVPFYSLKPPNGDVAGFTAGNYTTAYQSVVEGLPYGSHLAVYHEPEDDLTGSTFLSLTQRAYDDAKAVRPDVTFWYVAMAYQWETNSKGNVGSVAGWLDAAEYVDAVGIDVYAPSTDFKPMSQDGGFARWFNEIAAASGTPWGVSERGVSGHAGETARADILAADWSFLCRNGGQMLLLWDADWDGYPYKLTGSAEKALMRGVASQGRCR